MSSTATADNDSTSRDKEQSSYKETCNKHVKTGIERNVTVQFLFQRLIEMGCNPPGNFIKCMDCGDRKAGGGFSVIEEKVYSKEQQNSNGIQSCSSSTITALNKLQQSQQIQNNNDQDGRVARRLLPEIFLCQQHVRDETHAHESLSHELIHAIDLCRTNMDPMNNCLQMACTEIRAENLSGECSNWMRELSTKKMTSFLGHQRECVKRRAIMSVNANPKCKDKAKEVVDLVFDRCYKDTFPFDRHPNLK